MRRASAVLACVAMGCATAATKADPVATGTATTTTTGTATATTAGTATTTARPSPADAPRSPPPEPAGPATLPPHADVLYRLELAGHVVGTARLRVDCRPDECLVRWASALRAPDEAGAGLVEREVVVRAAPSGDAREVTVTTRADGEEHVQRRGAGPPPAGVAELLLSFAAEGEERCITVREEETGEGGRACARRSGPWLEGRVLGEPTRFRAAPGTPAEEVIVPTQRARFVADPAAAVPAHAASLFGQPAGVPRDGPVWCGTLRDPAPPPAPPAVPRRFPEGASCREKTARYLAAAREAGLAGRHAVGLAWDGRALVWHEWAELSVGGAWIPVDPSFRQAPAEGPRFTLATWADGDAASRAAAGRKVLTCWSR